MNTMTHESAATLYATMSPDEGVIRWVQGEPTGEAVSRFVQGTPAAAYLGQNEDTTFVMYCNDEALFRWPHAMTVMSPCGGGALHGPVVVVAMDRKTMEWRGMTRQEVGAIGIGMATAQVESNGMTYCWPIPFLKVDWDVMPGGGADWGSAD